MIYVKTIFLNFFFFPRMIFKTIKNMQNCDFPQKLHFLLQEKKFELWLSQAISGQTR